VTQDRAAAGRESAGDETLAEAFWAVARRLRDTSQETLAPWDITPAQLRALRMLRRHGVMRLSELSDRLRIAPRSATEVVDDLEARGIAERHPDPADRRATLVSLTDKGMDLFREIRAARHAQSADLFAVLDERDRAELGRILATVLDAAREKDGPAE
jgi:DNA-binding MarR family transcriptional regulator